MSENINNRIEALEFKIMHQESAVEELTQTVLSLEKSVSEQTEIISRLETQVRSLTPSNIATQDEETPPPHY